MFQYGPGAGEAQTVRSIDNSGAFAAIGVKKIPYYSIAPTMTRDDVGYGLSLNASRSSAIYGNASVVQPEAVRALVAIRY